MSQVIVDEYGFQWGPAIVERIATLPDGRHFIAIKTVSEQKIEVSVSAQGRNVQVWKNGRQLT